MRLAALSFSSDFCFSKICLHGMRYDRRQGVPRAKEGLYIRWSICAARAAKELHLTAKSFQAQGVSFGLTGFHNLQQFGTVLVTCDREKGAHRSVEVNESTDCKVARPVECSAAKTLMMVSRPYLTLVAIGLSGMPYTGSPAEKNCQTATASPAMHNATKYEAQTKAFVTILSASAVVCALVYLTNISTVL